MAITYNYLNFSFHKFGQANVSKYYNTHEPRLM